MKIKQYSFSLSIEYDALILECGIMQQYVDHSYFDYAVVDDEELGPMKKNCGGVIQPFPGKVSVCREMPLGCCSCCCCLRSS